MLRAVGYCYFHVPRGAGVEGIYMLAYEPPS